MAEINVRGDDLAAHKFDSCAICIETVARRCP